LRITSGDRVRDVRLEPRAVSLDGERLEFRVAADGAAGEILEIEGRRHRIRVARRGDLVFVWCDGEVYEFTPVRSTGRTRTEGGDLLAPMPGRIRQTCVSEGEAVRAGQLLLILEAMKMEHAIRAPRDGTVRRLPHREGDLVETGTPLVEIA
jgi:3-methylcrotonyl-CoA carboxylase alpha subunit